jgi:hypothetical protein
MNNTMRVVAFLCLILSAAGATPKDKNEELNFQMEPGWKVGNFAEGPNHSSITEYIREGDDINNWSELVTIQSVRKSRGAPSSPDEMLKVLKAMREKECPSSTEWNVIDKNENSILFEWQAKPCLGWPEQHELEKIIDGKHSRFLLHYAAKVYQLSPDTRTKWIKKFAEATISQQSK